MKKVSLVIPLLIVAMFAATGMAFAGKLGTRVKTQNGLVVGTKDTTKDGYRTWSWKGIPFAQPPQGRLRWKAPQPARDWGVLMADEFGSMCPQYVPAGFNTDGTLKYVVSGSEDCLYLNVWRPRTQERNLPVYFWIHGGGNSAGTGSDPWYHGNKLAPRANMVVVTINYRLGPLGWFLLPESLQDGNPLDKSGNYGTLDIIQALRWVRKNIAAFGGDPNNVTIAGESAGGFNVCTLLISPLAKGLFHKAISESGGFFLDAFSMEDGRKSAQRAIEKLCPEASDLKGCLMSKTAADIFGVYPLWVGAMLVAPGFSADGFGFADRFTDGTVISAVGKEALKNPETYNQVPTMLGTNKEEWKLIMALKGAYGTMTDDAYQNTAMGWSMLWQATGVNALAADMSGNKGQPGVYAYRFDYGANNPGGYNAWPYPYNVMIGASHMLEIPFIFGEWTYLGFENSIFRPDNKKGRKALSHDMVKYWASFARTGTPTDPGGVVWEPWSNKAGGAKRILFDADDTKSIITMSNQ